MTELSTPMKSLWLSLTPQRREFLLDTAKMARGAGELGLGLGLVSKQAKALPAGAIRPPGAGLEDDFQGACIRGGADLPRATRYWILALILLLAASTGGIAWELVNPVSMLPRGLLFGMGAGWLLIGGIFLFDLFVMKNGWCGHLCPVGAFHSLLGRFSVVRVTANQRAACNDCLNCFTVCPEQQVIKLPLKGAKKGASSAVQLSTLRDTSVNAADSAPEAKAYLGKRPGQFALIERSFASQPPLTPHSADGYDISQTQNACWDCHNSDEFKGKKMPMVSKSHLIQNVNATAEPTLDMKRWQCDSCHVPQVDAMPLVGNDFKTN